LKSCFIYTQIVSLVSWRNGTPHVVFEPLDFTVPAQFETDRCNTVLVKPNSDLNKAMAAATS
jgi:hypothetical protein